MMHSINWEKGDVPGVWAYQAAASGPTAGIIGGIHGDERAGIAALRTLRAGSENIEPVECGTLILIAGNLAVAGSIRHNTPGTRFKDVNLNRMFREPTPEELSQDPSEWPYELRRAQELRPTLDMCAATLDIHEYSDPKGRPFIIGDGARALRMATQIGAPIISSGWSETEPGGTDEYMYRRGKIGLCYEVGCKQYPVAGSTRGVRASRRFLQTMGMTDGDLPPLFTHPTYVKADRSLIRQAADFTMLGEFHNFQAIGETTEIARDGDQTYSAERDEMIIFPPFAGHQVQIGEEICSIGRTVRTLAELVY